MDQEANTPIKLHIILDNIRSAFNVGSIFRTADAVGSVQIHLCGITSDINNPKIYKTALGATESVPSKQYADPMVAIKELREKGIPIYAIELCDDSEHFQKIDYPEEVALVFGHEINGVNQLILDECDKKVYIPMNGIKESLNVANTAAIMMYEVSRGRIQENTKN